MKRSLLFTLTLLCICLSVLAERRDPSKNSRIFWDTATRKTVFTSGGYSRIIELQDGRLMACCESNGIDIAFSSNKGSSWTSPEKIVTNQNNVPECVPDLIQLTDGTIIVAYNPRPATPYTEDRRFGIRCKRSTDNGKTWSDEIFVNDASYTFNDGCWEPSLIQLPSGEVQLYFADEDPYTSNNDQQISMCRSYDGGQTWTTAQKVAYRQGYRDGMPSAILLQDGETIAIAFEDNGWGYGDFVPTVAICPLATNWNNYWVPGTSSNRWRAVNYDISPLATGGAPYLRKLPWGETIISHQSGYGEGAMQMWVYVGNEQAKDFRAMSAPFSIGSNDQALWNSLAVIDTGVVVAVAGIGGHIEMEKGYPVRQIEAPYGKPTVNGRITRNEGYLKPMATQMILGRLNGTRFASDFAYNEDSLYFVCRVSDTTPYPLHSSYSDGVTLQLDANYASDYYPVDGIHRIFFRTDSAISSWHGDNERKAWVKDTLQGINYHVTITKTYYVIEAAIPWKSLGTEPADYKMMRVNVMLQNNTDGTTSVQRESIPDANYNRSYTWMDFLLLPNPKSTDISRVNNSASGLTVKSADGRVSVSSVTPVSHLGVYDLTGRKIAESHSAEVSLRDYYGLVLVKVSLANGTTATRKIIIR